jgi:galactonate dehydratase
MKITKIERFTVWVRWCNWYFIRLETDDGITGWGEGSLHGPLDAVDAAIDELGDVLLGREFEGTEVAWQHLYHAWRWRAGSVIQTALSAFDLALWDIEGKHLGVPAYRLLGGAIRQDVPAYSSHWLYNSQDPNEAFRQAQLTVRDGFNAFKWGLPRIWDNRDVASSIDRAVDILTAAREGAGPKCRIFIDCAECLTRETALRMDRALEGFDIGWLEEPLPFENPKAMIQLSREIRIPIATGERLLSRWEYRELLENGACAVVQPDVMHAGGLTEVRKIANAAEIYSIPVAPHNPAGPIATLAGIHLGLSLPNFLILETMADEKELRNMLCTHPIKFDGGVFQRPELPGLGTELDVEQLRKMPHKRQPIGEAPRMWLG